MKKRAIPQNSVSITGKTFSIKNDDVVSFESTLERDFYTILEFDPNVESYTEQLIKIEYINDLGVRRRYTPDVFVKYNDDTVPWLCEVKYRDDLRENFSKYKPKFRAAKEYCEKQGWKFVLVTEDIRNDYFDNARTLLKYKNMEPDFEIENQIVNVLKKIRIGGFFTPELFRDNFGKTFEVKATGLAFFWRMVLREYIVCDLTQKINMKTEMWLNDDYYE